MLSGDNMAKKSEQKLADQITVDELSYHQSALSALNQAQIAVESWGKHLTAKYALGQKDSVGIDGIIRRGVEGAEATE